MDSAPLQAGNAQVTGLTERLQTLGNVIAGAAIVHGIRNFVGGIAAVGDELDKQSQALGLSTDALQSWRAAAGHAGVSAQQLTPAIQAIRRNAGAAAVGGAGMARDFRLLGVTLRDSTGELRGTDALMTDVAEGLSRIESPTERAAIAMRLMGESGARLLPLMANGAAGIHEAAAAFEALGGGMSEEAIAASAEYTDRMQDVDDALTGVKSRIGLFLLPAISRLAEGMSRATAAISAVSSRGRLLEVTFGVVAIAAAAASASTILAWVAAAAPFVVLGVLIGGLILVVEDLVVGFEGGSSALADLGNDMDAWASRQTGTMQHVAEIWTTWRDIIRDVANEIARLAGMGDDWLNLAGAEAPAQQANAMDEVRRIRAERAAAAERRASGAVDFQTPAAPLEVAALGGARVGGADRVLGALGGGNPFQYGAGAQVTQTVSVAVDARGGDPAMVRREVERGVRSALSRQADDIDETLGGQGGR